MSGHHFILGHQKAALKKLEFGAQLVLFWFVCFFFFTVVIPHVVRSIYQTLWLRRLSIKDSLFGPKDTVLIQFRNISSPVIHCTHSGCLVSLVFILGRVVTKVSSCWVNTTSRRGIKRLGISFGSIFHHFPIKVAGENPWPPALNDNPVG